MPPTEPSRFKSVGATSVQVAVPPGTTACNNGCGNLFLGTPILGFASTANNYTDSACRTTTLCSGFGQHIKNLGFNCQAYDGCIGWQNLYGEEEGNADTFTVVQFNFVGVDIHGGPKNGSQNFGPVLNGEVYTGTGNTACAQGTTGIYIGDAEMRGLNGWTINNAAETGGAPKCATTPAAAVLLDAMNTEVRNGHCEGFDNCVVIGANNGSASGAQVSGISGGHMGNAGTNVVKISNNFGNMNGEYVIEHIRRNFHTNGIMDNINNVTLSNNFISLYSYAGIRAGAIASGVLANTDLAGQCALGTLPGCTNIPFTQSYTSSPICTCSDTSAINACRVQVTVGTPTTLTITGASGDTIDYVCIGRN